MAPNFARNTLLGFISGAAITFSGFVGSAIAARLLGPDDFGVVAYVVWCVTISVCLLYTSPSPRDVEESRMPSSA